jgi:hypothetical protein
MGLARLVGVYCRVIRCRISRRKLAKAARDDFGRFITNPGAIVRALRNVFGWAGVLLVAGIGAALGGWITQGQYPYQVLGRKVLTPIVKPGEPVEIEIDGFRVFRCDTLVKRFVQYPDGGRTFSATAYDSEFGRLGHERYTLKIPTEQTKKLGRGYVYSYGESRCNPWEWFVPRSAGDPWIDEFEFGPATQFRSPDDVKPNERPTRE